jgi:heme a synthase
VLVALCTLVLLIAGALVTSTDAGLSVPDWPTSFGSFHMPPMVGGVKYEHGHRMVAGAVVILSLALTIWTWRSDGRRWLRTLLLVAMGALVAQAVLGGITVLFYLPHWVSTAHATLAQTFFVLVVLAVVFTGREWIEGARHSAMDFKQPRLQTLALASATAVYLQLVLGAAFRHSAIRLLPHFLMAAVVTFLVLWTVTRVLTDYANVPQLRRTAVLLLGLLVTQLALGFGSYVTKVDWGADAPQPMLSMIVVTVAHVAVGALVLATTVVLAIEARRHTVPPQREFAGKAAVA